MNLNRLNTENEMESEALKNPNLDAPIPETWMSLYILEAGQVLPLVDRSEFTLGRSSEDQPIMPDIDLSSYGAFKYGVSRLHAVVKKVQDQIVIMDLGSMNGTYLNGKRIIQYKEETLTHGDLLYLGKLKLQVLFY